MSTPVTHPRLAPRRSSAGATWWSKAWGRAVEEAAYSPAELRTGRALARRGDVGAITVDAGSVVAAVVEGDDAHTVTCTLPVLGRSDLGTLVEIVAAGSGRIGALLAGDLPHAFVEAVEEAGVELLPYGGELGTECTCDAWVDPCPHALAVLTQVGWLVQRDPFVLTGLRGMAREEMLALLHAATPADREQVDVDLDLAADAAERAVRALEQLEGPHAPARRSQGPLR